MTYEFENKFNAQQWAKSRAAVASQFRDDTLQRYRNQYQEFWCLTRDEVGRDEMQSILDTLGVVAGAILLDAYKYASALSKVYTDADGNSELEAKYLALPYEVTYEPSGRIILGELKEDWIDDADNE
jgi:hypothetical protein